ncbi:MAG: phage terminase large subunit, partial [Thermomicrobiales bacterium]
AEAAESQIQRDNVDEWYRETMRTRLEPGGAIIVTATRWHEDDLTGRLLDAAEHGGEQWRVLHMPAIDDEGEALWPDRWPVAALESIKSAVGTRAFTAQYQGRPQPAEGGMFKRHWWRYWKPRNSHLPPVRVKLPGGGEDYIHAVEIPADWDQSAQSWDMTFKDTSDGSYVVGLVGKRHGSRMFITDYVRERLSFTATLHALGEMTYRNPDVEAKLIEEKANGPAVISAIENDLSGVIPVQVEGSKEARAHAATPHVEAGNVCLPHPLLPGMGWVEDFIAELSAFPSGKHDDQVDAYTQLDRYLLAGNGATIRDPSAAWASYWANQ